MFSFAQAMELEMMVLRVLINGEEGKVDVRKIQTK